VAKTFYTERDIQDLADRGVKSLDVGDDIVLTDVARELAHKLGLRLVRAKAGHAQDGEQAELAHRVKAAVIARLGSQVDEKLVDAAIQKAVKGSSS